MISLMILDADLSMQTGHEQNPYDLFLGIEKISCEVIDSKKNEVKGEGIFWCWELLC